VKEEGEQKEESIYMGWPEKAKVWVDMAGRRERGGNDNKKNGKCGANVYKISIILCVR
jgi:hypothetical protein